MNCKRSISLIAFLFIFLSLCSTVLLAQEKVKRIETSTQLTKGKFPDSIICEVKPFYRHRPDKSAGREVVLHFKGAAFLGKGTVEILCDDKKEVLPITADKEMDSLKVLLPKGAGVQTNCEASIILRSGAKKLKSTCVVPALRQWTVYIYPHSHVDIGYTNTQANVELIHTRNLLNGIDLAKKTANYPNGARYLWNPEVLWPVERYLKTATPQQKDNIIEAVKKGYLCLDASYVNTNTSASADEELFEFFSHSTEMEKLTGTKIKTMVQVDVPGMSWGIVPVASQVGIKYIFSMNNGYDRVGRSTDLSFKPFWWKSVDGKSKVLFLQSGSYTPGATAKGYQFWPKMAGQTDTAKLLKIVKTDHPRQHFVDQYLAEKLPELEKSDFYPYDIFAMSWAMADNTPIDADLPDAVKSWNEDYAFPHLVIASATTIMETFEKKYGNQLPVMSGDFTEYWTDGLGTAAKQTSMNRATKERLIQGETLWTMLHPGEPAPQSEIKEAWRNVSMGTEHTWCYMDPSKQPITNDILQVKFGYFQQAQDMSEALLTEALSPAIQNGESVIGVFNTLSWVRNGLIRIPEQQSRGFSGVRGEDGKSIISQRLSTGDIVFMADAIPAFGSKKYFLDKKENKSTINLVKNNELDNGIVRLGINPKTGDISSLIYRNEEFVSKDSGDVNSYHYLYGDDAAEKATGPSNVKISIKENGPVMASVLVQSQAEGCNSLTREITIIAGQPFIEIKNKVDKQPVLKKEGIHFGFAFNINEPKIRADISWGVMDIDKDQLTGGNRNWIAFQRWLDISNNNKGVTWCSLDAPVFEVGNITANILGGATHSPKWIKKLDPNATIYSWALNNHWHTNFPLSQQGEIEFRYRILPHNSPYDAGLANRFGLEQAQPLIATPIKSNFQQKPLLSLEGNKDITTSILKTDTTGRTIQIRLRSVSDKDELVKLNWLNRKPDLVKVLDKETEIIKKQDEIIVPAMGFVTLEARFDR